jgi:chaperone required for assembly of F1-ATPase
MPTAKSIRSPNTASSMARNRSYKEVSVASDAGLQRVLLDGKALKTPGGAVLMLPSKALAQAIAEEWRAQENVIQPGTMILTKLANTATDRVAPNLAKAREQILAFGKSDVVCYRAEAPAELVQYQEHAWNPLLAWARERFGASFRATAGLSFVEQDQAAVRALDKVLSGHDAFALAGLYSAASLLGSLVIALALLERKLSPEEAFATANLDRIYQAERWGWDEQERAKVAAERAELIQISSFLELLKR